MVTVKCWLISYWLVERSWWNVKKKLWVECMRHKPVPCEAGPWLLAVKERWTLWVFEQKLQETFESLNTYSTGNLIWCLWQWRKTFQCWAECTFVLEMAQRSKTASAAHLWSCVGVSPWRQREKLREEGQAEWIGHGSGFQTFQYLCW